MGTLVAQPNNNDVDAAFKDHLGPNDWQSEAILRKVEALLRDLGAAPITTPTPTPTPKATMNGMGSASGKRPTPVLAGLLSVPANLLHSNGAATNGRGSPDSEASYNTALEDDVESNTDTTTNSPSASYNSPALSTSNNGGPANNAGACPTCGHHPNATSTRTHNAATSPLRPYPYPYPYPVYARTNPNGTDADFSDGGHTPSSTNGEYPPYPYTESPGVVPTGGALGSAATQGGMDVLEELRLLKDKVRDVSRVCNAVATGDLTQKITVPMQGDLMVQLKKVINTMVDNLGHFATEVTRGKLGAQAHVENVEGTWRELTDEVNTLAVNLTTQHDERGCAGVRAQEGYGGFERREVYEAAEGGGEGEGGTSARGRREEEKEKEGEREGGEGEGGRCEGASVRGIAAVTSAVAKGDLSKQIDVDANGEILDLKNTVNGMVLRPRTLAGEATRVTLEAGNQGKLGGEATVPDVEGVWFELVTNVNRMCLSLTDQVRSIATVTTAVARGDLSQKRNTAQQFNLPVFGSAKGH
ncbi:hypothetical protein B0H16DRAFT_1897710 [Mycena metata]|uniref:HAMP domain-containing protein n=1 Tax=Mycena metata TaxID=1033252 RepID=A0AAD7MIR2_9AGAR|nr:hypothetical protein B0H16DRAFT_1897710 [Mycena metata]